MKTHINQTSQRCIFLLKYGKYFISSFMMEYSCHFDSFSDSKTQKYWKPKGHFSSFPNSPRYDQGLLRHGRPCTQPSRSLGKAPGERAICIGRFQSTSFLPAWMPALQEPHEMIFSTPKGCPCQAKSLIKLFKEPDRSTRK